MNEHIVMVIKVNHRLHQAEELQRVFSEYGCSIKARLGLHEAGDSCANDGLIILHIEPGQTDPKHLETRLNDLEGITARLVVI